MAGVNTRQTASRAAGDSDPWSDTPPPAPPAGGRHLKDAKVFSAELDAAEMDDRERPTATWTAKSTHLSRSHMAFLSRRMVYRDRMVLIAIHLIDDKPVPLMGKVVECDYHGDGMHRTVIELTRVPRSEAIENWIESVSRG